MGFIKNLLAKFAGKKLAQELDLREGLVENKKWWTSKTVWSDVLTVVVGLWGVLQPVLVDYGVNLPTIPPVLLTLLGAMGIHGRVTATKTIG